MSTRITTPGDSINVQLIHWDCNPKKEEKSDSLKESEIVFPQVVKLFDPGVDSPLPAIFVEEWLDEPYYKNYGTYLEDKAGTGMHRVAENHPPCLKINGEAYSTSMNIFNYPKSPDNRLVETELIFTDCYIGQIKMKNITVENVGPFVIRYEWKRIPNYENSRLPIKFPPSREHKFHLDFRPGILIPGERKDFGVGFRSKYTGIYKEDWEFITIPTIHSNQIIFKFRALTEEKILNKPWNSFNTKLDKAVAEDCGRYISNIIMEKVLESLEALKGPPLADIVEDEEEVFLYINKDLYTYNEIIVKDLKEFYQNTFTERWNLNMFDFHERLMSSKGDLVTFKRFKIKLMKSNLNVMTRSYYKSYNAIFELLGDATTEIQQAIDKARQKYGFKTLLTFPQVETPPYYHFPPTKAELALIALALEESKLTAKKGGKDGKKGGAKEGAKAGGKATTKTADKPKGKGKTREYINFIPKPPNIIRKTEWEPENLNYANDVYSNVYQILATTMDDIEGVLNPEIKPTEES